jgi:type IX secretion system PorP/SprF family membrane protein
MKKLIFFLIFILTRFGTWGQQQPLYGLYFLDPYMINPAAAGLRDVAVLNLNHRQQWRGIEGAPVTSTLSLHAPVGSKIALGGLVLSDARGPISTNTAQFSFGYRVPVQDDDHNLRFGLGGGAGWNRLDYDKLGSTSDPVLAGSLDNYFFVTGRFGALYNYRKLFLGFVFPSLFRTDLASTVNPAEVVFEPLQNYMVSASYRFDLGENFALEPYALYRAFDRAPAQWEGSMLLHIKDLVWLGGTWRQDAGMAGAAGFRIGEVMHVGYSYEPSSEMVSGFGDATHELHLSLRIGKKKPAAQTVAKVASPSVKTEDPPPAPPVASAPVEKAPAPAAARTEPAGQQAPDEDGEWLDIEQSGLGRMIEKDYGEAPVLVKRGRHPMELPEGHFVISGVFSRFENAERYSNLLNQRGFRSSFGFLTAKGLYYVWLYKGSMAEDTRRKRDELRRNPAFRDAWYLQVEE